jgi:hypothetical protein
MWQWVKELNMCCRFELLLTAQRIDAVKINIDALEYHRV